jgi:splicing factor 3B subunit 3
VVGSDSGRFSVLEYVKEKNRMTPVQLETFGKSGCRRIVPGQYVVVDPKGRAAMIGSMEKQKVRWPRQGRDELGNCGRV